MQISRALSRLPSGFEREFILLPVLDDRVVHSEEVLFAALRDAPPLLDGLIGGFAVHGQHIPAVLALLPGDELLLLTGLPQVLGFIIAGILCGTAIWGLIFPDFDFSNECISKGFSVLI